MPGLVWVIGGGTIVFAGVIAHAMTRRYGWGAALALPVLALALMIATQWQRQGLSAAEGVQMARATLVFAAPILLGAAIGITTARLRRR
jgi:membrane protease YdiL (CAAX protease family)